MTSGKFAVGNRGASKLTPQGVQEIRRRYEDGETQGKLSREFGVSVTQIGRIVRWEVWQEIAAPGIDPETMARMRALGEKVRLEMAAGVEREKEMHPDALLEEMDRPRRPGDVLLDEMAAKPIDREALEEGLAKIDASKEKTDGTDPGYVD